MYVTHNYTQECFLECMSLSWFHCSFTVVLVLVRECVCACAHVCMCVYVCVEGFCPGMLRVRVSYSYTHSRPEAICLSGSVSQYSNNELF